MRDLVSFNNPILHKRAEPVKEINGSIQQLLSDMTGIMEKAAGVGIAAPQVGESLQIAIVNVPKDMGGLGKIILVNPKITSAYGSEVGEEGCLSIPGVHVKVKRYKEVVVESMDLNKKIVTYKASGLTARAVQHEVDHLNGVLIVDKLSPVKRIFARSRVLRKIAGM